MPSSSSRRSRPASGSEPLQDASRPQRSARPSIDDGANGPTDNEVRAGQLWAAGIAVLDVRREVEVLQLCAAPSELDLNQHADFVDLADNPVDASDVCRNVRRHEGRATGTVDEQIIPNLDRRRRDERLPPNVDDPAEADLDLLSC